jgi:hypothetical protein
MSAQGKRVCVEAKVIAARIIVLASMCFIDRWPALDRSTHGAMPAVRAEQRAKSADPE